MPRKYVKRDWAYWNAKSRKSKPPTFSKRPPHPILRNLTDSNLIYTKRMFDYESRKKKSNFYTNEVHENLIGELRRREITREDEKLQTRYGYYNKDKTPIERLWIRIKHKLLL